MLKSISMAPACCGSHACVCGRYVQCFGPKNWVQFHIHPDFRNIQIYNQTVTSYPFPHYTVALSHIYYRFEYISVLFPFLYLTKFSFLFSRMASHLHSCFLYRDSDRPLPHSISGHIFDRRFPGRRALGCTSIVL
jgi:hypothetical protein